jgi:hypothetical protein
MPHEVFLGRAGFDRWHGGHLQSDGREIPARRAHRNGNGNRVTRFRSLGAPGGWAARAGATPRGHSRGRVAAPAGGSLLPALRYLPALFGRH